MKLVFNSFCEYREELEDFMYLIIDRVSYVNCNGLLNFVVYDVIRFFNF